MLYKTHIKDDLGKLRDLIHLAVENEWVDDSYLSWIRETSYDWLLLCDGYESQFRIDLCSDEYDQENEYRIISTDEAKELISGKMISSIVNDYVIC